MGLFNFLKYNSIEKALLDKYTQIINTMEGVCSSSQSRKKAENMLNQAIEESKKEGTYHLPGNLGDIILGDIESNNPAIKKIAESIRQKLSEKKTEGVKEEDIRWWWNLNDIERRMMLKQDDIVKMKFFMFVLENSNESCKEKAADEAAIQIRKFYPIYGDSNDTTHTTGDDRPLPYELKDRIDVYIEKRVKENSEKYKSEVQQSSTFNALIRKEIKAGNLLVRKLGSQMTSLKTSSGRPFLSYSETFDENKTAEFVRWFIKNEPFANVISNRSSNIIFEAGNIPSVPFGYNPSKNKKFDNLSDWFISKLTQDIKKLKMVSQSEFKNFLDKLGEAGDETLIASGKIGVKYNLNFDKFIYENEVQKIPEGEERDIFKKNFLDDNVISAEQRILAWLYNEWFEEAYKIPEK